MLEFFNIIISETKQFKCPIDELNTLISLQLKNIPIPIFDLKLMLIPLNKFNKNETWENYNRKIIKFLNEN